LNFFDAKGLVGKNVVENPLRFDDFSIDGRHLARLESRGSIGVELAKVSSIGVQEIKKYFEKKSECLRALLCGGSAAIY
jgi:hypothetical protein